MKQSLRIIGGQYRGRRIRFPEAPGLRPTGDRMRETVFNWLREIVLDARCLDLFAGSGALGLEALSRGAAFVHFNDYYRPAVQAISETLQTFQIHSAKISALPWQKVLDITTKPFDLVFIDPPFSKNLWQSIAEKLAQKNVLSPSAHIYLEMPKTQPELLLPANWKCIRHRTAGEVGYFLFHIDT